MSLNFTYLLPSYTRLEIPQDSYENIVRLASNLMGSEATNSALMVTSANDNNQNIFPLPAKTWLEKKISEHFSNLPTELLQLQNLQSTNKKNRGEASIKTEFPDALVVAPLKSKDDSAFGFLFISKTTSTDITKVQKEGIAHITQLASTLWINAIKSTKSNQNTKIATIDSKLLFNLSPIPKYLLDLKSLTIVKVNVKMSNHFGYQKSALIGKKVTELLKKEEVAYFLKSIKQYKGSTTSINFGVFTHIDMEGKSSRLELIGHYLGIAHSETILFACNDITEKEKSFLELRHSQHQLKTAASIAKIGYWSLDLTANTITLSDDSYAIWGRTNNEGPLPYASFLKTIHPLDQQFFQLPNTLPPKEQQLDITFRIILPDTSIKWIRSLRLIELGDNNNPQYIEGVFQDITNKKKLILQKELSSGISRIFNQEHQLTPCLRKVLRYVASFGGYTFAEIWLPNSENGHLTLSAKYASDEVGTAFHHDTIGTQTIPHGHGLPGAVFQNRLRNEWDPTDIGVDFKRRDAAKKTGIKKTIGVPLCHHKELIGVLVLGESKEQQAPIHNHLFFETLERYLGSELQRKLNELELSEIFNSIPDLLAIIDTEGNIKKINAASVNLIGYSAQELLKIPITQLLHPDDLNEVLENIQMVQDEQEMLEDVNEEMKFPIHEITSRYITKNGEVKSLRWRFTGALQKGLILAIGKDISEEIRLNSQLEMVNTLAQIGSWEMHVATQKVNWCPITRSIYEVDDDFEPSMTNYGLFTKHDRDLQQLISLFNKCISGEIPHFDYQLPIITAKGNKCWVRAIGRAEFLNEKCTRIYGKLQNIHQFKMTELAFQNAYKEKNRILNSIQDAFISVDSNWKITYWNKSAEKLMSISSREAMKRNLWDIFPNVKKQFDRLHKPDASLYKLEDKYFEIYNDTIGKWLEVAAYPTPNGMSFYIRDISSRIAARKKLEEANERFEKASEASNDVIYDRYLTSNYHYMGKDFKKLFGHDLDSVSGNITFWEDHIHENDRSSILDSLNKAYQNPEIKEWKAEYRFLKANKEYAHVLDTCLILRKKDGVPFRIIGSMADITQQKKYEQSLVDLNRKLKEYSNQVEIQNTQLRDIAWTQSHIVRAPVARILGLVDLMRGELLDETEKGEMLGHIETSTMELDEIIKKIVTKTEPITPIDKNEYGL
ncbi:PAS domain S-box protein [Arenibacter amylolyticus]|uniref:PAS domain S-box protein n=1 Tax=Arenibacter amylolyticus TaxID=1406873 RepID=UPI000A3BBE56|nr:PAS domain S-box protein [Arenibacter amylolyticus]